MTGEDEASEIELKCGGARARIALMGAQWRSWTIGRDDLLWNGDPQFWDETAPLLFPIVGWTHQGIRVAGRSYPLGLHGFARHHRFKIIEKSECEGVLALKDDAQTQSLYPFPFRFEVVYRLEEQAFRTHLHVINTGDGVLPFACGVHPGFRWPLPGSDDAPHQIIFDRQEHPWVPMITEKGLFSSQSRNLSFDGKTLPLTPEMFSEALVFRNARSQGLEFSSAKGILRAEFENFPHLAFWTRPGAPFLCLEAWTGHGDPDGFTGDIMEKPSMLFLPPGERAHFRADYIWRAL